MKLNKNSFRKITINVTDYKGELLFDSNGIKFDLLIADEFLGGSLKVMREGKIFDETNQIKPACSKEDDASFRNLEKLFEHLERSGNYYYHSPKCLTPNDFKENDMILATIQNISFYRFLINHHHYYIDKDLKRIVKDLVLRKSSLNETIYRLAKIIISKNIILRK